MAEGGLPGYEAASMSGMFAPAKTPRPIIDKVQGEIARAYADPVLKERIFKAGINPVANTPETFAQFIQSETRRWSKVVKESGIELN